MAKHFLDHLLILQYLIGWQLSIWIFCTLFFSLLYNCLLLCSWRFALSIVVEVFPLPFFPNIAPSRMFTTNSLCLIVCPIHKWRLFLKILKMVFLLSPFEKLHLSLFYFFFLDITTYYYRVILYIQIILFTGFDF